VTRALDLPGEAVFRLQPPLDHRYLDQLIESMAPLKQATGLVFPPYRTRQKRKFLQDPFKRLDDQDVALYHPLDDYGLVEAFVQRAARDEDVDRIRISLYRMGRHNSIADALIEAAHRGKDVAVLLEGRARFDELQNLHWNLLFQQAGIRILPLPFGYKVHAKALLVWRRGKGYLHLGTGNYSPANGRLYTDVSLFTANQGLVRDATAFFHALERQEAPDLTSMLYGLAAREEMLKKIRAEAGPAGRVIAKMNHLADPLLLNALLEAAHAGTRVDLIARSTLTVYDEAFNTRSLIGRFLEHPRIVAFRAGGRWDVWAGSADWMARNFEDRIELVFPLLERKIKRAIIRLLEAQLADDVNAFVLEPDGTHRPLWGGTHNSQMMRL
jgi:polyphosphate kinase